MYVERGTQVLVDLPDELLDRLHREAEWQGVSPREVITAALHAYLAQHAYRWEPPQPYRRTISHAELHELLALP